MRKVLVIPLVIIITTTSLLLYLLRDSLGFTLDIVTLMVAVLVVILVGLLTAMKLVSRLSGA